MRLADDHFELKLGSKIFILRPTLRAAFRLDQIYEGFQNLHRAIADGSLGASTDLISQTVTDPTRWAAYALAPNSTIARDLLAAPDQLLAFLMVLIGANEKSDKSQTGKPISFGEYFVELFRIGTGWLGWSPAETWASTPAEILNAHAGRVAMLKAIFGSKSSDDQPADIADGSLASVKDNLNAIGDLTNHIMGSR
jgi:hypothetical protein